MAFSNISVKRAQPLMGTFVRIELRGTASEDVLQGCAARGFWAVQRVERLMSVYRPDSEISRLNRTAAGRWVRVHPLVVRVLSAAEALYRDSQGVFDIRRPPKARLATGGPPERRRVEQVLEIQGRNVRKTGPWVFDLGGIAKGFAVDHAIECIWRYAKEAVTSGSVNAGGDLCVWGDAVPQGRTRLGRLPRALDHAFELTQPAVATSEIRRGSSAGLAPVSYWRPSSGALSRPGRAATVFAKDCLMADALTKVVLLGSSPIARHCLTLYGGQAVIYGKKGDIQEVLG
jgi:FAD:protein FMN transferase